MSAAFHKQLRLEAFERRCKTTAGSDIPLGANGGATGLALAALEAALSKALAEALPRTFMVEGLRLRVKVSELKALACFVVRDQNGELLIDGGLPFSIK